MSRTARGGDTSWRVTQLPSPDDVMIECDGSIFTSWRVTASETIEIMVDVGDHLFRISTGYHGTIESARSERAEDRPASNKTVYIPEAPPGGACCAC